ncbi:MAG: TipAS antibiotic-recognition domain-containing protein [Actinomycetota bacterium]|nr:TipAS antibiotic-recognition domain-containing protein [Actinomycetota bacterium]
MEDRRVGEGHRPDGPGPAPLRRARLLEPSERTGAGHRLYREAEVGRLYRIVALRRLGLGLDEIGSVLGEGPSDLSALVREHVGRLKHEVDQREGLRRRLLRILDALEHASEPSVDQLIEAMEAMTMIEKHYTPDQLSQLEARRRDLSEEGMQKAQEDWTELIAAVEAERQRGTDPADPRVQELATRWQALVEAFTGGDPGIERSLHSMYEQEGVQAASRGALDEELMAYVGRAMEARPGRA